MSVYTTSTAGIFIGWETIENLGTLFPGEKSELFVKLATSPSIDTKYHLTNGVLPSGLKLEQNGIITGVVPTNTSTSTLINTSTFSIIAKDNHGNNLSTGTFSITVNQTTSTEYTNVYFKPLQTKVKRREFYEFVNNEKIFEQDLIYRPNDLYFGIQHDLKLVIDFGVELQLLENYANLISTNFQRRRFSIGNLKYAKTTDKNNNIKHYILYFEVIDKNQTSNNVSVSKEFIFNGITYFPSSIKNMKEKIKYEFNTTENFNPGFLKEKQIPSNTKLGFIPFIPICFAIPSGVSKLYKNIINSNFIFKNIDFDIDRIYIEKSIDYQDTKYLLLNRTSGMT